MPPARRKKNKQQAVPTVEESLKDKGNKAFLGGHFVEAKEYFSKAIEEEPDNHLLYSNRSATYAALKEFTVALGDAEKCVELKPEWPKGHFRKGHALEHLLQYPEAYVSYNRGLELDGEDKLLDKASKDLHTLMEELKMEREINMCVNPDEDRFEKMCRWMKKGGCTFPKLYLQYYSDDYRGCHSLTKIPPDEVILYVPLKYIMTSEVAKSSDIGQKIINAPVDLRSKHSYLASYLLQEKHKKNSFWQPYLDVLPIFYANMPIFFDEEVLAGLKGSFSLQKIADRIDSLRREFDNIRRAVPAYEKFTHEEFVWARLVVITRIFGLVIKTNKTDGLVPYADMLNHKVPKETTWTFDDARDGMIITSLKTIQRGDQVFDSYGRKCNSRFFVNYGFALDDNEDNEAVIRIHLPRDDPHYAMKISHLGGDPANARREFQIPGVSYRQKKVKEFFSFLRFVHGKDSDMMVMSGEGKLEDIEPISIRNEIEVLKHMKLACEESMAQFSSSLEDDEKLIDSGDLPEFSNVRNCAVMRRGEKRVLNWYIQIAERAIPMLKQPWKDLKRTAAKASTGLEGFDSYVNAVVVPLVKKAT